VVSSWLIVLNLFSFRQSEAKLQSFSSYGSGQSNELSVLEERDVQQAGSTDWAAIVGGTALGLGALILAGRALWPNRDNQ
jgi:hypothetical protein